MRFYSIFVKACDFAVDLLWSRMKISDISDIGDVRHDIGNISDIDDISVLDRYIANISVLD